MDVSLSGRRVFFVFLTILLLTQASCGNRYDLSNERGRRARIDDANFHLSKGECGAASEAIDPLYNSEYVTDEVRIVKASAVACFAHYNLLKFAANFSGASNYFQALAKSLDNSPGDSARSYMYGAVDVLTKSGVAMDATGRTRAENTYMVFLQFGVISSILRNYGNPDCCNGTQGSDLIYEAVGANPAGEMSDTDACALAASFSAISDSYAKSDFNDVDTKSAVSAFDSLCVAAGIGSCASLNRDRSQCNGTNQNSIKAAAVVSSVNSSW